MTIVAMVAIVTIVSIVTIVPIASIVTIASIETILSRITPLVTKTMKTMEKYIFETRMEVRDYECDIEGIVNNANYLHYTEHTRHRFLKSIGVSFAQLHEKGIDAVVARMNLQFKTPLHCDDEIISRMKLRKEGIRYVFTHDLFRASDERLCFHCTAELVTLINGRLGVSPDYDAAFAPFIKQ